MKRVCLFFTAALFASAALMTSCEKDDGGGGGGALVASPISTLDVKIEGGSEYNDRVSEVRLIALGSSTVLAVAEYSNGGFKMDLPVGLSDEIISEFDVEEGGNDVDVSNMDAKLAYGLLEAYSSSGRKVGDIHYTKMTPSSYVSMMLIYSDSDVTIVKGNRDALPYNLSLKKGWNQTFFIGTELSGIVEHTTNPQSGMTWIID